MATPLDVMIPGAGGRLAVRAKGLDGPYQTVAILVHGANLSGQTGFDFSYPGGDGYSMMDDLVGHGIAAVTFGVRGYGHSELTVEPLTVNTDAGIEDLRTVAAWLQAEHQVSRFHLLGWSWGGRIAARFTEQAPERVMRLVMYDPALGGDNVRSPELPDTGWQANSYDWAIGRLEPDFTDPDARHAFGQTVAQFEPRSPNGIRAEVSTGTVAAIPENILRPTAVVYGGAITSRHGAMSAPEFFDKLATDDKILAVIPRGGHYLHLQRVRHRLFQLVSRWFSYSDAI